MPGFSEMKYTPSKQNKWPLWSKLLQFISQHTKDDPGKFIFNSLVAFLHSSLFCQQEEQANDLYWSVSTPLGS